MTSRSAREFRRNNPVLFTDSENSDENESENDKNESENLFCLNTYSIWRSDFLARS